MDVWTASACAALLVASAPRDAAGPV